MPKQRNVKKMTPVSLSMRIFLALIVVFAIVFFATKTMENNKLKRESEALRQRIAEAQREVDDLQYNIDAPIDEQYVESYAKDELDMNYPDEKVYYNDIEE